MCERFRFRFGQNRDSMNGSQRPGLQKEESFERLQEAERFGVLAFLKMSRGTSFDAAVSVQVRAQRTGLAGDVPVVSVPTATIAIEVALFAPNTRIHCEGPPILQNYRRKSLPKLCPTVKQKT